MSLDEISDDEQSAVLKAIDKFAKNRVIVWTGRERIATDICCHDYLAGIFKDKKDVKDMYSIYEAKVRIYTMRR